MATTAELVIAIKTDRHNVSVYLAALAKGPLNAKQTASLATDLKTLDVNLAALDAALANPNAAAASAPAPDPTTLGAAPVYQADPTEVTFDPSTWPPLQVAAGTVRMGKYGELFGSAIPGPGVYTDVQTSGGGNYPPMMYLFLRGKIIYAQEGNVDPAERIRLRTQYRPANTTGLTF